MSIQMEDIAGQLGDLRAGLADGIQREMRKVNRDMVNAMGEYLEGKVEKDVFGRASSPDGRGWRPFSPLTRAVYRATGRPLVLGGRGAMKRSFLIGDGGNLWRVTPKGFVYGSKLKRRGHVVARTFQETFKIPKSANDKRKAVRVRSFMMATAGVPAPGVGKQLTHPGRRLLFWTSQWRKGCASILEDYLTRAIVTATRKAASTVRRRQTR